MMTRTIACIVSLLLAATAALAKQGGKARASLPYVNVLDYGFVSGGTDNSAAFLALMSAMGGSGYNQDGGFDVRFPPIVNQHYTDYYFSKSMALARVATIIVVAHPQAEERLQSD
jgi:hypothetical protein